MHQRQHADKKWHAQTDGPPRTRVHARRGPYSPSTLLPSPMSYLNLQTAPLLTGQESGWGIVGNRTPAVITPLASHLSKHTNTPPRLHSLCLTQQPPPTPLHPTRALFQPCLPSNWQMTTCLEAVRRLNKGCSLSFFQPPHQVDGLGPTCEHT